MADTASDGEWDVHVILHHTVASTEPVRVTGRISMSEGWLTVFSSGTPRRITHVFPITSVRYVRRVS